MSGFKIEPLHDWEWGLRASLRLMWHHRLLMIPLTLMALVLGYVLPAQLEGVIPNELFEATVTAAMAIGLTSLFLKFTGVETSWRSRIMAAVVILALEIGLFLIMSGVTELLTYVAHPGLKALISLAIIAFFVVYVHYTFCLCVQVLVDGQPNFLRSYKAVASRKWRLWLSFLLFFVLWLPFWGLQNVLEAAAPLNNSDQALLPYLARGIEAFVWALSSMAAAALSTIWFLHPRVRTPEESTTWEVPTIAQPG